MRSNGGSLGTRTTLAIIVAALGYFVDVFDIWLFSAVRVKSLQSLGLNATDVRYVGEQLINWQMGGFVIGALLFGVIADRKGRLAVLFGSILTYSLANIANGFVHGIPEYAACRFIAGVGLSGELGAGIALVSELVSTSKRGWATTFVATVGVSGSVAAPLLASSVDWRTAYFIGGGMGLALLLMRVGIFESGMFERLKETETKRGDLRMLFANRERIKRYLATIFSGAPVWFFAGLMMTFSKELQEALKIPGPTPPPQVIAIAAFGLCVGDIIFGGLSQAFKSRRIAFWLAYVWMTLAVAAIFLLARTADMFFWLMFIGGVGAGYWAVFVTTAGETFGTNLRGTVATSAPSFVRGLVIPMTMTLKLIEPNFGMVGSLAILGAVVLGLAAWSVWTLPETFHRDMDFVES